MDKWLQFLGNRIFNFFPLTMPLGLQVHEHILLKGLNAIKGVNTIVSEITLDRFVGQKIILNWSVAGSVELGVSQINTVPFLDYFTNFVRFSNHSYQHYSNTKHFNSEIRILIVHYIIYHLWFLHAVQGSYFGLCNPTKSKPRPGFLFLPLMFGVFYWVCIKQLV